MLLRIPHILVAAALVFVTVDRDLLAAPHTLISRTRTGDLEDISVTYEAGGKLTMPGEKQNETLSLRVDAVLAYQQRWLEIQNRPPAQIKSTPGELGELAKMRAVRHYDRIETKLVINEQPILPELRPQCRLIVASIAAGEATLFSPKGTLTRDELDLVSLPGDRLVLELLLPKNPVEAGSRWEQDSTTIAMLFGLDAVGQSDVSSVLKQVIGRHAIVEMSGTVQGAVEGVASEIEMKARYYFDRQSHSIVSFQLVTKETREIGHVTPGVEVVAKLKMRIAPRSHSAELHEIELAELELEPTEALTRFEFAPQNGQFRFLHDRKWHVTADDGKVNIIRRMDRGDLIAQCKISAAEPRGEKETHSLEKYTQDVKKAVGEHFGRVVSADESQTASGATIYRVDVAGKVSDLQIRWRYYLVTAADGRRASAVFTMEEDLVDRFGTADRPIIETLEFLAPTAKDKSLKPTPLD
jgi:hypothetical protein